MDLWSDDPAERLKAARDPTVVGDWPNRIGAQAPTQPWPYGMPTSINPFVVFLGASPGNSPPTGEIDNRACRPYELPTAGSAHPKLYVADGRDYWKRVREAGSMIVQAHSPEIPLVDCHGLIGQLNLSTGQVGEAKKALLEAIYCRWIPDVLLDYLRPSFVILLGLSSCLLKVGAGFDPSGRLGIDWRHPDQEFPFASYKASRFRFRLWNRRRPDGRIIRLALWPQHPSRPPMTHGDHWGESAREFIHHVRTNSDRGVNVK